MSDNESVLQNYGASTIAGVAIAAALAGNMFPASDGSATHPIRFTNAAAAAGVSFILENSATGKKYLPETMVGGVATFDYDGDGLTDIYFVNGATIPALRKASARYANRLYRNLGGMRFQDVTAEAGVEGSGYDVGVAAADYDNDGHVDLFVAGVGKNTLFHNRGNGTFEDVTARSGIANEIWSVGGAWFDYDNDGRLDLLVANYLKWSPEFDRFCGNASAGIRTYCDPRLLEGLPNRLYHNEGNGRFRDVSAESGILKHIGKAMGVAVADYDGDGYPDVFVTNDKMPNFLFHNLGNGAFEEVGFRMGVALTDNGAEISNMGADFRDCDNDGLPDIIETALSGETFPFFRNGGTGGFVDAGLTSRMSPLSRIYAGWGVGLFDFDNDGWKDVFTANSHVNDRVEAFEATEYKQHNAIFRNRRDGVFEDVSAVAGPDFRTLRAHRGCAFADFNRDGKIDVVVTAIGEPPEVWENVTGAANTYVLIRLIGTRSNRDGIGAVIRVGDQYNAMTSSVGYASSSHFGVHFGTGTREQVPRVVIRWPSGVVQTLENVRTNQMITVREPDRQ